MDLEFDELKREFLAEADEKIREIRSSVSASYPPPTEKLERAIYLAHQLKGAGGSYGFSVISTESAELERDLEKVKSGEDTASAQQLDERIQRIAGVIESSARQLAKA